MNSGHHKTRDLATIAMGVATLIGGGFAIYIVSSFLPLPGTKYLMMAPFLSTVLYVMQIKVRSKYTLIKFGVVFALIMTIMNLFMGLAIILTTLATHLSLIFVKEIDKRAFWGSILFSGYTGVFALTITKVFIGGPLENIAFYWFVLIGLFCSIFGILGTYLSKRVLKNIEKS